MRISDWVQTCALPIYLVSRYEVCDFSVCPLSRLSTASSDVPQSVRSLSWILLTEISRRPGATVSIVVPVELVSTLPRLPFSRPMRRSEEHTSELQSLMRISYAVFCLKKKKHSIKQYQTIVDDAHILRYMTGNQ